MMLKKLIPAGAALALGIAMQASSAAALPVNFGCITNNNAGNCATGAAELSAEVTDIGGGQVQFDFAHEVGDGDWSLTDVYFDDVTLLGIASIFGTSGVDFAQNATLGNLPGGNGAAPPFIATAGFSLDSNSPMLPANGVDMGGEVLSVVFDLMGGGTFADIVAELINGDLRIGLHVQSFANGDSESFVNNPITEPGTALLLGLGLIGLSGRRR